MKVPVVDVQVPRADCLRSQSVEQGNFGSAAHTNWKKAKKNIENRTFVVGWWVGPIVLTVGIFQALFLFGWL